MTIMEGTCEVCGRKIIVRTLDDATEYLYHRDKVIQGCKHYTSGSSLDVERLLDVKVAEDEEKQRELHRAFIEGKVKVVNLDEVLDEFFKKKDKKDKKTTVK